MDALETQLLIQKTQVKSPGLAAVLGFFFPAIAAFYTRRVGIGILFLCLDFVNLMLAFVGIGIFTGLLFRLFIAYFAMNWAKQINQQALEEMVVARKREQQQGGTAGA